MDEDSCRYDCFNPTHKLSANPDISGVGVTLAYSLTAALALLLVLLNYVLSYRVQTNIINPGRQVSALRNAEICLLRSNSIDRRLLAWRSESASGSFSSRRQCLEKALTQCMLVASDFQLVTGLSIMISGYTQLKCGLSQYHWQKIVQLAWFSSITHLCCLTFLSTHLSQTTLSQWRVPSMVVLVIMLIIALIPTRRYTWTFNNALSLPELARPAICAFFMDSRERAVAYEEKAGLQRMIISVTLLAFGMLVRLCRIYRLPRQLFLRLCRQCQIWWAKPMGQLYRLTFSAHALSPTTTIVLYRPALAVFLCIQTMAHLVSSRAFEIWWLALSLGWGGLHLWHREHEIEPESRQWNFGQVIALVLLLAPFLTLVENYWNSIKDDSKDESISRANSSATEPRRGTDALASPGLLTLVLEQMQSPKPLEHAPDYDFYQCFSFTAFINSVLLTVAVATVWAIKVFTIEQRAPLDAFSNYTPYTLSMSYLLCMLLALIFDKYEPRSAWKRKCGEVACGILFGTIFTLSILSGYMGLFRQIEYWLRISMIGVYMALSILQTRRTSWRDV